MDMKNYISSDDVIRILKEKDISLDTFRKAAQNGLFSVMAEHPDIGKLCPFHITDFDTETGDVEGYFLDD